MNGLNEAKGRATESSSIGEWMDGWNRREGVLVLIARLTISVIQISVKF